MIFSGTLLRSAGSGLEAERGTFDVTAAGVCRVADARPADYSGYALPGFSDSHAHVAVGAQGVVDHATQEAHLLAQRAAGVLAIRDMGSPVDTSWVDAAPHLPRIIRSARHLARPKRYIRGISIDVEDPHDLPEHVARQAALSDGWVKLVGDWIDRSEGADSDLKPLWEKGILTDAVAAAHEGGAKVAVHSFGHETIDDLLEAGVDDIEHASGMDEDQASEIAARGILVTPTLLQVELFPDFAAQAGAKYPVYARRMAAMFDTRHERFAMMRDAGVRLIMGTDSGGYQEHGFATLSAEMRLWESCGVSREELLEIATARTREALGFAPSYAEGDLIIYQEDPREVPALGAPDAVVMRGHLITAQNPHSST